MLPSPATLASFPIRRACRRVVFLSSCHQQYQRHSQIQCRNLTTSTSSQNTSRKQQIAISTGRAKKWGELSGAEKIIRTSSTGASMLTIVAGFLLTGAVFTFLYVEVLSPDSKTTWFNRAVNRVKKDPRCTVLLGDPRTIKAYGEPTSNRWARSRPLASTSKVDRYGNEHMKMHFNVEGNIDKGVVTLHVIKRKGESDHDYKYLYLDVPGNQRVYLENTDNDKSTPTNEKKGWLGVRWSW